MKWLLVLLLSSFANAQFNDNGSVSGTSDLNYTGTQNTSVLEELIKQNNTYVTIWSSSAHEFGITVRNLQVNDSSDQPVSVRCISGYPRITKDMQLVVDGGDRTICFLDDVKRTAQLHWGWLGGDIFIYDDDGYIMHIYINPEIKGPEVLTFNYGVF